MVAPEVLTLKRGPVTDLGSKLKPHTLLPAEWSKNRDRSWANYRLLNTLHQLARMVSQSWPKLLINLRGLFWPQVARQDIV